LGGRSGVSGCGLGGRSGVSGCGLSGRSGHDAKQGLAAVWVRRDSPCSSRGRCRCWSRSWWLAAEGTREGLCLRWGGFCDSRPNQQGFAHLHVVSSSGCTGYIVHYLYMEEYCLFKNAVLLMRKRT